MSDERVIRIPATGNGMKSHDRYDTFLEVSGGEGNHDDRPEVHIRITSNDGHNEGQAWFYVEEVRAALRGVTSRALSTWATGLQARAERAEALAMRWQLIAEERELEVNRLHADCERLSIAGQEQEALRKVAEGEVERLRSEVRALRRTARDAVSEKERLRDGLVEAHEEWAEQLARAEAAEAERGRLELEVAALLQIRRVERGWEE